MLIWLFKYNNPEQQVIKYYFAPFYVFRLLTLAVINCTANLDSIRIILYNYIADSEDGKIPSEQYLQVMVYIFNIGIPNRRVPTRDIGTYNGSKLAQIRRGLSKILTFQTLTNPEIPEWTPTSGLNVHPGQKLCMMHSIIYIQVSLKIHKPV